MAVTAWLGAAAVAVGVGMVGAATAHADTGGGSQPGTTSAAGPKAPRGGQSSPAPAKHRPTREAPGALLSPSPAAAISAATVRTTAPAWTRRAPKPAPAADTSTVQPSGQAVSPLGTPEQIEVEKTAQRTQKTLPVAVSKAVLRTAWRATAAKQYSLIGGPDKANLAALGQAVDEWAMASAFQVQILDSNQPTIVTQVAPPHQWYGQNVDGSRILYDNPDTIYRFTGVNYASRYVITGRLPENDPQASFSVLTGTTGTTSAVLEADKLELGPDRTFVITVSGDPALPGQKNHLQITPDTTLIAIRDTLADWNIEEPMTLAIQRTAGPPNSLFAQFGGFALPGIGPAVAKSPALTKLVSVIPPLPATPPPVRGLLASVLMLRGLSEEADYIQVATVDAATGERRQPNVFTDPTRNASFLATQLQSAGYFNLADDESLVLTIRPNNAGYFSAPVTNDWTITGNYADQQTSLNNAQAKRNPDGSYTLVVSPNEPVLGDGTSVWNWISTGGLNQGTMAIRFQRIDGADPHQPTVTSQVIKTADLASVLPNGTVYVTAAERTAQLTSRKAGFNRRFAPYPQP